MAYKMFRPSSAHRWMHCTASELAIKEAFEKGLICEKSSVFAKEGVAAAKMAEICITKGISIDDYVPDEEDTPFVDDDMRHHINNYLSFITGDGELLFGNVEYKIDLSSIFSVEDMSGTVDFFTFYRIDNTSTDYEIRVVDLKYGRNIQVDARDNMQLILYAIGIYYEFVPNHFRDSYASIRFDIFQPRLNTGPHIDTSFINVEELKDYKKKIQCVILDICAGKVKYFPSQKTCRFCPIKHCCTAYLNFTKNFVRILTQG